MPPPLPANQGLAKTECGATATQSLCCSLASRPCGTLVKPLELLQWGERQPSWHKSRVVVASEQLPLHKAFGGFQQLEARQSKARPPSPVHHSLSSSQCTLVKVLLSIRST